MGHLDAVLIFLADCASDEIVGFVVLLQQIEELPVCLSSDVEFGGNKRTNDWRASQRPQ